MKQNNDILAYSINTFVSYNVSNNGYIFVNTLNNETIIGKDKATIVFFKKNLNKTKNIILFNKDEVAKYDVEVLLKKLISTNTCFNITNNNNYNLSCNETKKGSLFNKKYLEFQAGLRRENLLELNLHLNYSDANQLKSKKLHTYTNFPLIKSSNVCLTNDKRLFDFIKSIIRSGLKRVNIIIGKINESYNYNKIFKLFKDIEINLYIINTNLADISKSAIELFSLHEFSNIIINCMVTNTDIDGKVYKSLNAGDKIKYIYLVDTITDVNYILENSPSVNTQLIPYYNGKNIEIFEDNVYIDKEDILHSSYTFMDINARNIVNQNYFGAITILPNGDAQIGYDEVIGNIFDDTLDDLLYKCHFDSDAWFLTRNKIKPCKDCFLCDFCPSIGNYEHAIGKWNLCNII